MIEKLDEVGRAVEDYKEQQNLTQDTFDKQIELFSSMTDKINKAVEKLESSIYKREPIVSKNPVLLRDLSEKSAHSKVKTKLDITERKVAQHKEKTTRECDPSYKMETEGVVVILQQYANGENVATPYLLESLKFSGFTMIEAERLINYPDNFLREALKMFVFQKGFNESKFNTRIRKMREKTNDIFSQIV